MFSEEDLIAARDCGLLSEDDYLTLLAFLRMRRPGAAETGRAARGHASPIRFDLTHVLWYAGVLVIVLAMALFTTEAFNRMSGVALTAAAFSYGLGFLGLGHFLTRVRGMPTLGGLAVSVAVLMVPVAIFGIQDASGLWTEPVGGSAAYRDFPAYANSSRLYMELGTTVAATIALRAYSFSFLTLIAAVALWLGAMDLAGWFASDHVADFSLRREVSLWFGLAVVLVAWLVDVSRRGRGNSTFWLHLFGAAALWGGLTLRGPSELLTAGYCLANIGLVLFAVFVNRRIYAILGAQGIAIYLGHLAYDVFDDAFLFSFALAAIGLMIIGLGLYFHKTRAAVHRFLDAYIPRPLRALRPEASGE